MRKTVHKWFWLWDFDKEEKWLNEMAASGLALISVGLCTYSFEECAAGEYEIRLELLKEAPANAQSEQYIQFIEETGAEYLGAMVRWAYFRKKKSDGEFKLYSDFHSRIKQLNQILVTLGACSMINLCSGFNNIGIYYGLHATTENLVIGLITLCLGLLLACEFLRVYGKKRKLQKENRLFES